MRAAYDGGMDPASSIVVTGASTGIGHALCLDLAREGRTVFGSVRREEDGAQLREASDGRVRPLLFDVTDDEAVAAGAAEVAAALDGAPLGALVNNAGIAVAGPLEYLPMAEFRRQMAVNVEGVLRTTQAFLPLMRGGRGRIVNLSSIAGRVAFPLSGPYNASKFALEGMSDALRMELQAFGHEVVLIEPGPVQSEIWATSGREAEEMAEALPARAREDYGPMMTKVKEVVEKAARDALPVEDCVKVLRRALDAPRPRTRYAVGRGPKFLLAIRRLLSDRVMDRLVLGGTPKP
ncbi:MAG: SDR family oxidoreductase [Planctomycetota bacterium]|jgi:NAD(P)-dependent dehydrogenase (short-subunit alcohol dehydrogenase family)